jgi:hypothetical protein
MCWQHIDGGSVGRKRKEEEVPTTAIHGPPVISGQKRQ